MPLIAAGPETKEKTYDILYPFCGCMIQMMPKLHQTYVCPLNQNMSLISMSPLECPLPLSEPLEYLGGPRLWVQWNGGVWGWFVVSTTSADSVIHVSSGMVNVNTHLGIPVYHLPYAPLNESPFIHLLWQLRTNALRFRTGLRQPGAARYSADSS